VWLTTGKPDPTMMCNGMLAGLVAITSPCAFVTPVGGFITGAVAGVLVVVSVNLFDKVKIDDPVGAISVHGTCGAWGLLAVGLFSDGSYGQGWNGVGATDYLGVAGKGVAGLFYGDVKQLVVQVIEVVVCVAWNVVAAGALFYVLGKLVGNRVPAAVEIAGLDIPEMGVAGYPEYVTPLLPNEVPAAEIAAAKQAIPALATSD
jgi:Amt family ammonium transporter